MRFQRCLTPVGIVILGIACGSPARAPATRPTQPTTAPPAAAPATWHTFEWGRGLVRVEIPDAWETNVFDDVVVISARKPATDALVVLSTRGAGEARTTALAQLLGLEAMTATGSDRGVERGTAKLAGASWRYAWRRASSQARADVVVLEPADGAGTEAERILTSVTAIESSAVPGDGTLAPAWRTRLEGGGR